MPIRAAGIGGEPLRILLCTQWGGLMAFGSAMAQGSPGFEPWGERPGLEDAHGRSGEMASPIRVIESVLETAGVEAGLAALVADAVPNFEWSMSGPACAHTGETPTRTDLLQVQAQLVHAAHVTEWSGAQREGVESACQALQDEVDRRLASTARRESGVGPACRLGKEP